MCAHALPINHHGGLGREAEYVPFWATDSSSLSSACLQEVWAAPCVKYKRLNHLLWFSCVCTFCPVSELLRTDRNCCLTSPSSLLTCFPLSSYLFTAVFLTVFRSLLTCFPQSSYLFSAAFLPVSRSLLTCFPQSSYLFSAAFLPVFRSLLTCFPQPSYLFSAVFLPVFRSLLTCFPQPSYLFSALTVLKPHSVCCACSNRVISNKTVHIVLNHNIIIVVFLSVVMFSSQTSTHFMDNAV